MTTKLKIFNRACTILGKEPVSDTEEESPRARALRSVYDDDLDSLLAEGIWGFAKTSATLTLDTEAATHPRYTYQYHLRPDHIRLFRLNGYDNETTHALCDIEGTHLLTDESSAKVEYVKRETDPGKFPVRFAVALGYKLALSIAPRMGVSDSRLAQLKDAAEEELMMALAVDASQVSTMPFVTDDLNRARIV